MSTNAVIRVAGFKTGELYKHWDGYPDSTLPWLEKFNKDFAAQRGDDAPYKFAQLIRSSAFDGKDFHLDEARYTGWGVFPSGSSHYDYLYILNVDGTVKVVEDEDVERVD